MENHQQKIDQLLEKLKVLEKVYGHFAEEIQELRVEINQLQQAAKEAPTAAQVTEEIVQAPKEVPQEDPVTSPVVPPSRLVRVQDHKILGGVCAGMAQHYGINLFLIRLIWVLFTLFFCIGALVYVVLWATLPPGKMTYETPTPVAAAPSMETKATPQPTAHKKPGVDLEKYIGENLISKIGIVALVIGVGIGAKYSIDNDLISPVVRIILGYIIGAALLLTGQRLKTKYENFSAVLVSGAMAIFYFMTFAAYSFYDMLSPITAFLIMVFVTVAAVGAALNYNKQFIAHIGLAGAYAIPFLLSEGEGRVGILFSYMAIINIGILVVAFRKYWKPLYLVAFFLTWLIVISWYTINYDYSEHFSIVIGFGFIFFVLFYLTFLGYKLLQKEPFEGLDIVLVLANSFVFYGLGYSLLDVPDWESYLGLYTLFHALVHGVAGVVIYRQKGIDKSIFYLASGMVLVFVTLAIPVQLDGSWVSLLWLGEAAVLFWIGRTKQLVIYEKIAYPVFVLAFVSLLQDWNEAYYGTLYFEEDSARFPSLLNVTFLSSLIFCGVLGYLNYLHSNKKYTAPFADNDTAKTAVSVGLSGILLLVLYFTFYLEIDYYWEGLFLASATDNTTAAYGMTFNYDLRTFKSLWGLFYFLLYTTLLMAVNDAKIKNRLLGILGLGLAALGLLSFLTIGLYDLSELRESYLSEDLTAGSLSEWSVLGLRYLAYAFVVAMMIVAFRHLRKTYQKMQYAIPFDLVLSLSILWVASSELLHWLDIGEAQDSYKLALTIFWGVYALGLSAIGIWKGKKHLRVAAIVLFGITLLKLFFYDLADLSTLSKTAVFVSLGILMLLISFLYNKFRSKISED